MDSLYSGNDSWHIAALENNSYCCVLISRLSLINCAENCKLLYLIINKNKQDDEILGIHRKAQDENHIKNDAQFTDTPPGASVSALTNWRMALDRLAAGISRSKWKGLVIRQESWQGTVSRRNVCRGDGPEGIAVDAIDRGGLGVAAGCQVVGGTREFYANGAGRRIWPAFEKSRPNICSDR